MNVVHILDMIWWHKEQKYVRINPNIVVHNLYYPKFYNIVNLPLEIKVIIRNLYTQFVNDIYKRWPDDSGWCRQVQQTLTSILTHMDSQEPDEQELPKLFKFQSNLDKIRKEDWKTSLKDIAELLDLLHGNETEEEQCQIGKNKQKKIKRFVFYLLIICT